MSRHRTPAGQQVAELAAKTADAGRLSRGRTLFRKGAVRDLFIDGTSIIATVRGSQGDDYATIVATSPAPPGVIREVGEATAEDRTVNELIELGVQVLPRDIDLVFDCTCADWEEPCKHTLAVLLAFADHVEGDPNQILVWRGIDEAPPVIRQPRTSGDGGGRVDDTPLDDRKEKISELEALLGASTRKVIDNAGTPDGPDEPLMHPDLVAFFGLGGGAPSIPDLTSLDVATALFAEREAGPLVDFGPYLAEAIELVIGLLREP